MYEQHFQLQEKPFSLLPDPSYLYLSEIHRTALAVLEYGLNDQAGFTVVSGEIGCGKTTLVRHLLDRIDAAITIGLMTSTYQSVDDILQWVLLAFDIESPRLEKAERVRIFENFVRSKYAQKQRTVLIVDEAQNLGTKALEELRMLSNINVGKDHMFQLILLGQPELVATLQLPELCQFAQRVSVDYFIETLTEKETTAYVRHRISQAGGARSIFRNNSYPAIFNYSRGVPRLINLICDTALVYAFGNRRKTVTADIVERVIAEKMGKHRIWRTGESTPAPTGRN
ncbi:MAG: general secretion pathway protein A [Gammaproteobacteria bacterium]|jgi:general secretion pathway protein A